MAKNQWGGYRQPSNPAPVSLPGAQSSRTDGGPIDGMTQPPRYMAGLGYGKAGNMPQQEAAPMAGDTTPIPATPDVIPLSTPPKKRNPIMTDGIDIGDGRSSAAVNFPNISRSPSHTVGVIAQNDPTGESELLYRALLDRGL